MSIRSSIPTGQTNVFYLYGVASARDRNRCKLHDTSAKIKISQTISNDAQRTMIVTVVNNNCSLFHGRIAIQSQERKGALNAVGKCIYQTMDPTVTLRTYHNGQYKMCENAIHVNNKGPTRMIPLEIRISQTISNDAQRRMIVSTIHPSIHPMDRLAS
jgi:hypothetical protein